MRIGVAKGADSLGLVIGNTLGGKIYNDFSNLYLNYGVSCAISVVCIIYILCFIVESVEIDEQTKLSRNRFCSLKNAKQSLVTCFKRRPERIHVILLIINIAILTFARDTTNYDFLMVRKRYVLLVLN